LAEQLNQPTLSDAFTAKDSAEICAFDISSVVLREVFRFPNDRKNKSVSLEMTIDPIERRFIVKAEGAYGACRSVISFAQHDFQRVRVDLREPFSANYPVSSLTPVLSAMSQSYDTRFKFKDNGMLAVQLGMKGASPSGPETIVEFIVQPCDENAGI
jgi:cell cycle checkpoint protein